MTGQYKKRYHTAKVKEFKDETLYIRVNTDLYKQSLVLFVAIKTFRGVWLG